MLARRTGLIVNITAWDRDLFLVNDFYDVAQAAINRMTYGIARELRTNGIAAIALAPGFMWTERVAGAFEAAGSKEYLDFPESPECGGWAAVALAADGNVLEKSGRVLAVCDVAEEYGFIDIYGRRIPALQMPDPA